MVNQTVAWCKIRCCPTLDMEMHTCNSVLLSSRCLFSELPYLIIEKHHIILCVHMGSLHETSSFEPFILPLSLPMIR